MQLIRHIILITILIGISIGYTQETKDDIEKKAQDYFLKEQYLEATPLFLRLLSLEPRSPNYNYKYGTCLLFNSNKKKDAFKYLNFAVQKGNDVENEAYYFLGKAYHLTYQFDKAIKNYEIYKKNAGSKALKKLQVDHQIQMCRNGKALMDKVNNMVILSKSKIDKDNFFRIYDLKNIGGELIVTKDFQTKQDVKYNHIPLIHFPAKSNVVYYSSYGENGDQKDIYERRRLPGGTWSQPQKIMGNVNSEFNEDFPYMDPNQRYLYFSSEGHTSMGGYDIFRSPYNAETNLFGEPENLDFPISSTDNDFFYIVDSLYKYAYFASQRETEYNKVNVYNVRVERFPIQIVILKGQFISEINPEEKKLSITVKDNGGKVMGEFTTSDKGDYLINIPKGGKYEFIIKVGNKEQIYTQFIDLPFLSEFRPLKQSIIETKKDGKEIIIIKNEFDVVLENAAEIIAEAMDQMSKMDVNKAQFDLDSLDRLQEQRKALEKTNLSAFSNVEILDLIDTKYNDIKLRIENTEKLLNLTMIELDKNKTLLQKAITKADSLQKLADKETDFSKKEYYTLLAQQSIKEANEIETKINAGKEILTYLIQIQEDDTKLLNTITPINEQAKNIDPKNNQSLMQLVENNINFFTKELLQETRLDVSTELASKIDKNIAENRQKDTEIKKLVAQQKALEEKIAQLEKELARASGKNKKNLEIELSKHSSQLENVKDELAYQERNNPTTSYSEQKEFLDDIQSSQSMSQNTTTPSKLLTELNQLTQEKEQVTSRNENTAKALGVDLTTEVPTDITDNTSKTDVSEDIITPEDILEFIDPNYYNDIDKLDKNGEGNIKTTQELIARKRKTIIKIEDAIIIAKQKNESQNKLNALNELKQNIEQEIVQLETQIQQLQETAANQDNKQQIIQDNFTPESILKEVDPAYTSDIKKLEKEAKNDITSKNKLIERKRKALIEIGDAKTEAIQENASQNKIDAFDALENKIQQEIIQLEIQIQKLQEIADNQDNRQQIIQDNFTPESILKEVDPAYTSDIKQLEEETKNDISSINNLIERKRKALIEIGDAKTEAIQENASQSKIDAFDALENKIQQEIIQLEIQIQQLQEIADNQDEKEVNKQNNSHDTKESITSSNDKINQLTAEKEAIEKQQQTNPTPKAEKEIQKIEQKIAVEEVKEILPNIADKEKELRELKEEIPSNSSVQPFIQQSDIAINQLEYKAEKEKDPIKKRDILKEIQQEQEKAIIRAKEAQQQNYIEEILTESIHENHLTQLDPETVLDNKNSIREEQKNIGIHLLEINDQIDETDALIAQANKKDKTALEQQKNKLIEIKKDLKQQYDSKTEQLLVIEEKEAKDKNKGIAEEAIQNPITYKEEVGIALTETYKQLLKENNKLTQLQYELKIKKEELSNTQEELKQVTEILDNQALPTKETKESIRKYLITIGDLEEDIEQLRKEIGLQQQRVADILNEQITEEENKNKYENMIARDVLPIAEAPSLPTIAMGLILNEKGNSSYTDTNPIPIDLEKPKGLIFRVQIGAFNKPVANETFKEFSPISAETARPGLLRYMAGYFNSKSSAEQARDKIRVMGYSDAFIVAYCDGERIPVWRAMELLQAGACVPSISAPENIIVETNNQQTTGNAVSFTKELDEMAYNKAPGAAPADVAESKMGLYFTVQVGVYNRPVPAAQLFNITPLITMRLENGQIRYSSGIYNSFEEARPHQQEVIQKGIDDAFITAYYQGKRISVQQARELLKEKGESILELNNPTIMERNEIVNKPTPDPTIQEEKTPFLANKNTQIIWKSIQEYSSFPTQILNRYNADEELFYYDSITKHVYSLIRTAEMKAPLYKEEFEPIELYKNIYTVTNKNGILPKDAISSSDKNGLLLNIQIPSENLNSDIIETIINAPFYKSITISQNQIAINFFALETGNNKSALHHLAYYLQKLGVETVTFSTINGK
ncbi:MAG: hypothetical protein M9897_14065 [Brumimicrobium sp.]|nr:hypothetical protein [Brumimicrobium sp.]